MQQRGPSGPNHYESLKQSHRDFEDKKEPQATQAAPAPEASQQTPLLNEEEKWETKKAALNADFKLKFEKGLINRSEWRAAIEKAENVELMRMQREDEIAKDAPSAGGKELTAAEQARFDRLSGPSRPENENEMGPDHEDGPHRPGRGGRGE